MPWWNRERRARGLAVLGIFGITGGLAFAGSGSAMQHAHSPSIQTVRSQHNESSDTTAEDMPNSAPAAGKVEVNGSTVELPSNGTVKKTITNDGGSTSIDYSASSTNNTSNTDIRLNITSRQSSNSSSIKSTFTSP